MSAEGGLIKANEKVKLPRKILGKITSSYAKDIMNLAESQVKPIFS